MVHQTQGIGFWLYKRQLLHPEKEAVVDGERRVTYQELNQRVNRLGHGLQGLGLQYGERIGILAHNCLEFVEVIMAAAKLGLILVPLNWRLTPPEIAFNLQDSQTTTLVVDHELLAKAEAVAAETEIERSIVIRGESPRTGSGYASLLRGQPEGEPVPDQPVGLDTAHIIMYTAGTTGRPKGAVLSQGASFWNALNLESLDFTSKDRDLLVLPMFHIGGIGLFTLPMLYHGATVVIQQTFDPARTLKLLQEEAITLFFGVPAIFLFLIQHQGFDPTVFATVRTVMSGGAPLPISLVKQYKEQGIDLQQGFGMSEAGPSIATLSKGLAVQKAGSIGRAVFHLEVKVVDDQLQELPCGQVGELVMRGPNLMQHYWNRPEATAEAFAGGWFHSGDLAWMDEDGDIFIVERKKDMFISGGENVYPAEVENVIYELDQVSEAAVIGVKHEKWGEAGLAVIALKTGQPVSEQEVHAFLQDRLAKYKLPGKIIFVQELPRNAAGKVLKTELREQFGQ